MPNTLDLNIQGKAKKGKGLQQRLPLLNIKLIDKELK